jgi:hypothetical protein
MPKKIPYKLKGHYDSFENPDAYAELYSYPQRDRDYGFMADAIQSVDDPALLSELLGYDATPYEDASYDFEPTPASAPVTEPMPSLIPSLMPQKKPTAGPVDFGDINAELPTPGGLGLQRIANSNDADNMLQELRRTESLRYPRLGASWDTLGLGTNFSVTKYRDGFPQRLRSALEADPYLVGPSKTMAGSSEVYDMLKSKGHLPISADYDTVDSVVDMFAGLGTPSDPTNFNSNAGSAAQKAAGLAEGIGELPRDYSQLGRIPDWAKSPDTGVMPPDVVQQIHGRGYHLGDMVDHAMPYLRHTLPDLASSLLRRGGNAMVNAPQLAKDSAKLVSLFKKLT